MSNSNLKPGGKQQAHPEQQQQPKRASATPPVSMNETLWNKLEPNVQQASSSLLSGATIAIDLRYLLRRMEPSMPPLFTFQSQVPKISDHLSAFCCNAPLTFSQIFIEQLQVFSKLNMKVLLVLDGMVPTTPKAVIDPTFSMIPRAIADSIKQQRDEKWAKIGNGTFKDGLKWDSKLFESVTGPRLSSDEVIFEVIRLLSQNKDERLKHVDFIRAPCSAQAQAAYFAVVNPIVHCVMAPPTVFWNKAYPLQRVILEVGLDKFHFMEHTGMSQFSELPMMTEMTGNISMSDAYFQNAMVISSEGDIHNASEHMDPYVYVFHSFGILSTSLLTAASHAAMVENAPAVDTKELRSVLERIIPLRTQITCKLLPVDAGRNQLKWFRWFKGASHTDVARPPTIELDDWDVTPEDVTPTFFSVMKFNGNATKQKRSFATLQEISTVIHLKFLDLLGYFTHSTVEADSAQTSERSGKSTFSEALSKCDPKFCDSAVLLIELIRTKGFNWESLQDQEGIPIGPPTSEERIRKILFFSRLFSLAPVELHENAPWTAPMTKDMIGFWCILRTFRITLRHLGEVIAVTTAPNHINAHGGVISYATELGSLLPYTRPQHFVLGAVMEYAFYMSELKKGLSTPEQRVAHLSQVFPAVKNMREALENGFKWCEDAAGVIKVLSEAEEEPPSTKEYLQNLMSVSNSSMELLKTTKEQLLGTK